MVKFPENLHSFGNFIHVTYSLMNNNNTAEDIPEPTARAYWLNVYLIIHQKYSQTFASLRRVLKHTDTVKMESYF